MNSTTLRLARPDPNSAKQDTPANGPRVLKPATPHCAGTILVVDDVPMILRIVEMCLGAAGYKTLAAANAEEALALADDCPELDLLITDFEMPGMNGLELAARICHTHPRARILLMSGSPWEVSEVASTFPGQFECLAKPFSRNELLAKIRATIAP